MKISLNIRTGYTFRGRKNISDSREIAVIQPTDVDSGELKDTISYIAKDQVSPLEKQVGFSALLKIIIFPFRHVFIL